MKDRVSVTANSHLIGLAGKEMVRRAIQAIRRQRGDFESTRKGDKNGRPDFFTSADLAAQEIYVKLLRECFPDFGVVAEEKGLSIPFELPGPDCFFTVDPLDGTKAYIRRQSHGIGTMLSLVYGGEIVAAFVGDVMTGEIYYYRPESNKVHRLFGFDEAEDLRIDPRNPLSQQYVLLRDFPAPDSRLVGAMVQTPTRLFKSVEISGGSIGINFARLWKGEVGGMILDPTDETPWDCCPVWGISKKLGFVFLNLGPGHEGEVFDPKPTRKTFRRPFEVLVIHKSRVQECRSWLQRNL